MANGNGSPAPSMLFQNEISPWHAHCTEVLSMNSFIFAIGFFLLLSAVAVGQGVSVPSSEEMRALVPESTGRLNAYDRHFPAANEDARETHARYSDPEMLREVEVRLERVRQTGDGAAFFEPHELAQLERNLADLRTIETGFFGRWYLRIPMSLSIQAQRLITSLMSRTPVGERRDRLVEFWRQNARNNPLYGQWGEPLPEGLRSPWDPRTWGELLIRFNENENFRRYWVQKAPQTLVRLIEMTQVWAWDDTSVRRIRVESRGSEAEHWVLEREVRPGVPNRFEALVRGDFESLLRIEYAPTLFFNRLSRISQIGGGIIYHLEAIEKGRTMEPTLEFNQNGSDRRTFPAAEVLRKSKADEFLQREHVNRGEMSLFFGYRTLQLNQIQALMARYPELTLVVGRLGFSITGGPAQTVSSRTDGIEEQRRKMVATLIDALDFARSRDVSSWFHRNVLHTLRTIGGGVGAGGQVSLSPIDRDQEVAIPACSRIWL